MCKKNFVCFDMQIIVQMTSTRDKLRCFSRQLPLKKKNSYCDLHMVHGFSDSFMSQAISATQPDKNIIA